MGNVRFAQYQTAMQMDAPEFPFNSGLFSLRLRASALIWADF
jgi:hypothetical protein